MIYTVPILYLLGGFLLLGCIGQPESRLQWDPETPPTFAQKASIVLLWPVLVFLVALKW